MPVGTILPYQGNDSDIPEKWHLCDGTNNTPDLRDGRFLEGSSSAGSRKNPALPNIKGDSGIIAWAKSGYSDSGPFTRKLNIKNMLNSKTDTNSYYMNFDAHKANPIYSDDCNTVQPKSYTVKFIMKIKA